MIEAVASILVLGGAFFALVGSIGLVRLSDFFSRLHAPTKASTLGVGGVLLAAVVAPLAHGDTPGWHELLLTLFVFVTAPVAANLLALAGLRREALEPFDQRTTGGEVRDVPGTDEGAAR